MWRLRNSMEQQRNEPTPHLAAVPCSLQHDTSDLSTMSSSNKVIVVSHYLPYSLEAFSTDEKTVPKPCQTPAASDILLGLHFSSQLKALKSRSRRISGTVGRLPTVEDQEGVHFDSCPSFKFHPRRGHSALYAGIKSLKAAQKVVHVGWLGGDSATDESVDSPSMQEGDSVRPPSGRRNSYSSETMDVGTEFATGYIRSPVSLREKEFVKRRGQPGIMDETTILRDFEQPKGNIIMAENLTSGNHRAELKAALAELGCVPVFLGSDRTGAKALAHGYYDVYCKTFLWPLLHYIMWGHGTDGRVEDEAWGKYQKVNSMYAEAILEVYEPGDTGKVDHLRDSCAHSLGT